MKTIKLELTREEALAAIVVLELIKKPYHWQKEALGKLLKAMGLKPLPEVK